MKHEGKRKGILIENGEERYTSEFFDSTAASAVFLIGTTLSLGNPDVGIALVKKYVKNRKNNNKKKK